MVGPFVHGRQPVSGGQFDAHVPFRSDTLANMLFRKSG